jgi:hypothetical protein
MLARGMRRARACETMANQSGNGRDEQHRWRSRDDQFRSVRRDEDDRYRMRDDDERFERGYG